MRPSSKWLIGAALAAAVGTAGAFGLLLLPSGEPRELRLTHPTQVTRTIGRDDAPMLSPDGVRIAYHSDQSGNPDIWITQLGGGESVNLTKDYLGVDWYPAWSPDGSEIAFWSEREGGGYFVIVGSGGNAAKGLE